MSSLSARGSPRQSGLPGLWRKSGRKMKTYVPKISEHQKKWYLYDASDQILGRLASEIAKKLRGKDNPLFTPHLDMGHYVIVVNAEKVKLSGQKSSTKAYYHHTGYPGGLRKISFEKMIKEKPDRVIAHAVKGMLPHNRLGRKLLKKLHVYRGREHPHQAQEPERVQSN